ncbi:hypothetical protein [Wenjunlia tyrosinilytica]|uniref:hypothetical protein n=1 Tax=Wenjunlia tyrosinilytica TaxID=1544741 RepID=UPI0027E492A9|nr:hypothetical protein [Wenjunlia tyrosinilytica]
MSDLNVAYQENGSIVGSLRTKSDSDWLTVAGDVAEIFEDVEWALTPLSGRFSKAVRAPGNHELWTHPGDPVDLRGEKRYLRLVEFPLVRGPTDVLRYPEFAQWCGTEPTAGGHTRLCAVAVVYGHHPHFPRTTWYDGVRLEEVSIGCPREWKLWPDRSHPRRIPPRPDSGRAP